MITHKYRRITLMAITTDGDLLALQQGLCINCSLACMKIHLMHMEDTETPLSGGQMTQVVKVGDTVHRTAGPWTPAVHQLLKHLGVHNFKYAPRPLGFDDQGREILTFVTGDAGFFSKTKTVPADLWSDQVLIGAAQILKQYHDDSVDLALNPSMQWQSVYPDEKMHEVICHNDFAPYNLIFEDGHIRAIIDFDTAGPGPRIRDIAYAAYSFIPLFTDEKCERLGVPMDINKGHRLQLFCEAYGVEYCDRIVDAIIKRIEDVWDTVVEKARDGDARYAQKIKEGHVRDYESDIEFLQQHKEDLEAAIK